MEGLYARNWLIELTPAWSPPLEPSESSCAASPSSPDIGALASRHVRLGGDDATVEGRG